MVDRPKCKMQKQNTGENLGDLGYGDEFLDITAMTVSVKERMGTLNLTETKKFCSMDNNAEGLRKATNWGKIFATHNQQ